MRIPTDTVISSHVPACPWCGTDMVVSDRPAGRTWLGRRKRLQRLDCPRCRAWLLLSSAGRVITFRAGRELRQ